jgi:hypothetical protein
MRMTDVFQTYLCRRVCGPAKGSTNAKANKRIWVRSRAWRGRLQCRLILLRDGRTIEIVCAQCWLRFGKIEAEAVTVRRVRAKASKPKPKSPRGNNAGTHESPGFLGLEHDPVFDPISNSKSSGLRIYLATVMRCLG